MDPQIRSFGQDGYVETFGLGAARDVALLFCATVRLSSTHSHRKRYSILPEDLARRWNIGLDTAKRTLRATTQRALRNTTNTVLTKRIKPFSYQLLFRHLRTHVYTDTMFSSVPSYGGNKCAQVYASDFDWTRVFPMKKV